MDRQLFTTLVVAFVATTITLTAVPSARAQLMSAAEIAQFEARLKLTPEQKAAVKPVMQESMRARQAIFKKHGVDLKSGKKPGLFGLMGMSSEMNEVSAWTEQRLSKILNPSQLQEHRRIVAEQTDIVKRMLLR
jgi:hypothetical protein